MKVALPEVYRALKEGHCGHHWLLARHLLPPGRWPSLQSLEADLEKLPCCGAEVLQDLRWYWFREGSAPPPGRSSLPQIVEVGGLTPEQLENRPMKNLERHLETCGSRVDLHDVATWSMWYLPQVPLSDDIPDTTRHGLNKLANSGPGRVRFLARVALGEVANTDWIAGFTFKVADQLGQLESLPAQGTLHHDDAVDLFLRGLTCQESCSPASLGLGLCRHQEAEGPLLDVLRNLSYHPSRRLDALVALTLLDFGRWLPELKRFFFRVSIPGIRMEPFPRQDDGSVDPSLLDESIFPYESTELENVLGQMTTDELTFFLNSPQPDCRIEAAIELVRRPESDLRADHFLGDMAYFNYPEVIRLLHAAIKADQLPGAMTLVEQCLEAGNREVRLMAGLCATLLVASSTPP